MAENTHKKRVFCSKHTDDKLNRLPNPTLTLDLKYSSLFSRLERAHIALCLIYFAVTSLRHCVYMCAEMWLLSLFWLYSGQTVCMRHHILLSNILLYRVWTDENSKNMTTTGMKTKALIRLMDAFSLLNY